MTNLAILGMQGAEAAGGAPPEPTTLVFGFADDEDNHQDFVNNALATGCNSARIGVGYNAPGSASSLAAVAAYEADPQIEQVIVYLWSTTVVSAATWATQAALACTAYPNALIEILNEPNLNSFGGYTYAQAAAATVAVVNACPPGRIIGPAVSQIGEQLSGNYLGYQALMYGTIFASVDPTDMAGVAFHLYPITANPFLELEDHIDACWNDGEQTAPVFLTEYGIPYGTYGAYQPALSAQAFTGHVGDARMGGIFYYRLAPQQPTPDAGDTTQRYPMTTNAPLRTALMDAWGTAPDPPPEPEPGFGTFSETNRPPGTWRPYGTPSPFNTPLPANPTLHANSANLIASLMALQTRPNHLVAGRADTVNDFYHPVYYSDASDPTFTINGSGAATEIHGTSFKIPNAARAAGGDDGHLCVVDQTAQMEYDMWQVTSKPSGGGTLVCHGGGKTPIGTSGSDGLGSNATAAHFGLLAGIIRAQEWEDGAIEHALFMTINCSNGTSKFPAGTGHGATCSVTTNKPAMGQKYWLNMDENEINALATPEYKKTILRALHKYGAYFGDTGGGAWGFSIESGSSYTSFGQTDAMVSFAQSVGIAATGSTYVFRLDNITGLNWSTRLKALA